MDLFTFLLCKKKGGGGGGGLTYTLSADTVNKQIVLTPSEGDAQAITVPYATDASTVNGKDVPELENGKIPATYLPSYVDDVLEYEDLAHFPAEGEVGKIYIALDTSLIYRWGGSVYAEINQSLALGETEATAYRGDRGKIAYDHSQSAHAPSNAEANQNAFSNITVGDTTIEADSKTDTLTLEAGNNITLTPDASTDKVTITATDTTYSDATTSVSGLMSGSDKTKLNGIATGAEVNQNTFSNVKIGSTTVAADSKTDTLELEAGDNIELTPDSTNDKITISGIPVTKTIRDVSIASFSDGGNAPIPSLTASIVPVQDLHGYDSPWVGGAGKNKYSGATSLDGLSESNGVYTNTATDSRSYFSLAVIAYNNSTAITSQALAISSTGRKSVTLNISSTPTHIIIKHSGSQRDLSIRTDFTLTGEFTVSLNAIKINPTTVGGLEFKEVMIESGSQMTNYLPYSNICPISGWTEEVVSVRGINQWDEQWELGGINNQTGGLYPAVDRIRSKNYIPCIPNQTIYLKATSTISTWAYYDINKNFILAGANVSPNRTITTIDNAYYIKFGVGPSYGTTYNNDISINYPSTNTEYHAYSGTTTTIPFTDGQGNPVKVYGGSVDIVNGGEQPRTLGSVDLGELEWGYDANIRCWNITIQAEWNMKGVSNNQQVANATAEQFKLRKASGMSSSVADELAVDVSMLRANTGSDNEPPKGLLVYELATPTTFYTQPTSIKSLDGDNNVFASTGPLREVTYRTQAYGDFVAQKDLPDAISDIKTLKLDENQILIGDGSFDKIGIFMDDYYDENLDITFSTEVTPQEIYLTSQPAGSINQTAIIASDQTQYQTSLSSGTEVINTVNAIGMEVNVKENGSTTHGIKIVSGDIRLLGSDTWDGTNISLKNALAAIQNNLYIANYNKTASLSSGSNTVALDMTGYIYNGSDIVNVYVDGLYKINNTDYTITVNDSTGVASINYTAAAAGTMAIQVIKPKIGFTALTDNNENNVTDSNGNSIDI